MCLFRTRFFLCPFCQEPWEYREEPRDKWFGCGNFTCVGKSGSKFGCMKKFRIETTGDVQNPLAQEIFFNEFDERLMAALEEEAQAKRDIIRKNKGTPFYKKFKKFFTSDDNEETKTDSGHKK